MVEGAPYITVDPMNRLGMVLIKFSQAMSIPIDLTIIDDTVLHVELETEDEANRSKRGFKWSVIQFKSMNCTIQFVWDSPPWLSSTNVRDKILL